MMSRAGSSGSRKRNCCWKLLSDRAGRPEDARPNRIADDYSDTKANPEHAQQMQLVEPGETCADDERVDGLGIRHGPTLSSCGRQMLEA